MMFHLVWQIGTVNLKETCTTIVDQMLAYHQTDEIGYLGEFEYARQYKDVVFAIEDDGLLTF